MSITDELRKWVRHIDENQHLGSLTDFGKQGLTNLADRIDAEHRAALEKVAAMVDEPTALDALERRVSAIERKLNHRGER